MFLINYLKTICGSHKVHIINEIIRESLHPLTEINQIAKVILVAIPISK